MESLAFPIIRRGACFLLAEFGGPEQNYDESGPREPCRLESLEQIIRYPFRLEHVQLSTVIITNNEYQAEEGVGTTGMMVAQLSSAVCESSKSNQESGGWELGLR